MTVANGQQPRICRCRKRRCAQTVFETEKTTVFVYGSCVSRDTFEYLDSSRFELLGYVARQSLASAFSKPTTPLFDLDLLSSRFQRRMLRWDAQSALPELIEAASTSIDVLLWDLTDERLGTIPRGRTALVTNSVELARAQRDGHAPGYAPVAFGSEEHLGAFQRALESWRNFLVELDLLERLLVVAPPWAVTRSDGVPTPHSFGLTPEVANQHLRRYVDLVKAELGVTVIGEDLKDVYASPTHRWGPAPFHYDDPTYMRIASAITLRARDLPPATTRAMSGAHSLPGDAAREREDAAPELTAQIGSTGNMRVRVEASCARGLRFAYRLYLGDKLVDQTPYGPHRHHEFAVTTPGLYRCRVFAELPEPDSPAVVTTGRVRVQREVQS
jgi:hypothetical protein